MQYKTQSNYAETFAEIMQRSVNAEKYPFLKPEQLEKLQLVFYFNLENRILRSILANADEKDLALYYSNSGIANHAPYKDETLNELFDYERFDWLFMVMLDNYDLKAKVEQDIQKFADEFKAVSARYF